MDDMGKFTASDDFSLGTNEDDGLSDLFGAEVDQIPIVGEIAGLLGHHGPHREALEPRFVDVHNGRFTYLGGDLYRNNFSHRVFDDSTKKWL